MRALMLFAAILAVPSPGVAQDVPRRDPQAVQILAGSFAAMGGAQRSVIADLRVEGTLSLPGDPTKVVGSFVLKVRGSDFAVDSLLNGKENRYRVLKGKGSVKRDNVIKPLAPYQTEGLTADVLPLFGRLGDFEKDTARVEPPEAADFNGTPCIRLRVRSAEQTQDSPWKNEHGSMEALVDQTSGLVLSLRYTATQGPYAQDKVNIENRFSEYRIFSGLFLPTRIVRYFNDEPRLVLRIQTIQVNNGLTDRDFHN